MTQSQIAEEIGVSQMHVSRLLNRTLEQLRTSLEESTEPAGSARALRSSAPSRARVDARVQDADQHDDGRRPRARSRPQGVAAPEVPGQRRADQLGQHDRARGPTLARVSRQAHTSRPAP